jgi:predicted RecA/RadA family phage recombinase
MIQRVSAAALLAFAMLAAAPGAAAEQACKTTTLKNPAPKLADIAAMAEINAKAWKPDAVLVQISNTSLGLLQPDGSAASWHIVYYSDSAKSGVSIDTFRGSLTCSVIAGGAGRIPDLRSDFMRDGAKLYLIAKDNGAALLAQGYGVKIGTAAAPSNRHATWNINYYKEGANDGGILVLVNANTGEVEKVLK